MDDLNENEYSEIDNLLSHPNYPNLRRKLDFTEDPSTPKCIKSQHLPSKDSCSEENQSNLENSNQNSIQANLKSFVNPSSKPLLNFQNPTEVTLTNLEAYYRNRGCKIAKVSSGLAPKPTPHPTATSKWFYLTSMNFRLYQFNIVETSLFYNTMVCLPTGLGKTFIAANAIVNYYRWFPKGKIFFLAPSRPLVTQQMEALRSLETVDEDDIVELTGKTWPACRSSFYDEKRVFFMTPQTMQNDLEEKRVNESEIVLIVLDEAHRATGNYSYVKIIEKMEKSNIGYRILALSATPGNSMEYIQQVILNLCISRIEVRTESDPDVKPYVHSKEILPVVIGRTPDSERAKVRVEGIIKNLFSLLLELNVVPQSMNKFILAGSLHKRHYVEILDHMKKHKANIEFQIGETSYLKAFDALKVLGSFLHAKKLLAEQGVASFNTFLRDFKNTNSSLDESESTEPSKQTNQVKFDLIGSRIFNELQETTQEMTKFHPKFIKLRTLLNDFFAESSVSSKCMVFTHNRSTASDIASFLSETTNIKPAIFIGQANSSTLGMTQDEQLDVINRFKNSELNVLVATCIGEEGLDIGEIDLIVCFDSGFTPVRLLQRIGRTGRKRNGKVVMLLMHGKENECFKKSVAQSKKLTGILKNIASAVSHNSGVHTDIESKRGKPANPSLRFYSFNPRMIPEEITPELSLETGKAEIDEKAYFESPEDDEDAKCEKKVKTKTNREDKLFEEFEKDFSKKSQNPKLFPNTIKGSKRFDLPNDTKALTKYNSGYGPRPFNYNSSQTFKRQFNSHTEIKGWPPRQSLSFQHRVVPGKSVSNR